MEVIKSRPESLKGFSVNDLQQVFGFTDVEAPKRMMRLEPEQVRSLLKSKGYEIPKKVISFQMLKGGVAKTTTAAHIALRAAMLGGRVLLIDLDQQANLSFAFGIEADQNPVWVDLVEKKAQIEDLILPLAKGLDLIPSNLNNSVLDRVLLNSHRNWSACVSQPLAAIRENYDWIILDTAPNLSAINAAVTVASDLVILPVAPEKFSVLGARKHLADFAELQKEFGLTNRAQLLMTKYDARESNSQKIFEELESEFGSLMMENFIRNLAIVKSSFGLEKNLFMTSNPAKEDFDGVLVELMGWTKKISKHLN